ncbi:MAG: ABC transporter permease [Actinomycetota bacterium]|nr:ABC transporter permease [Actinomycetota bacterium]
MFDNRRIGMALAVPAVLFIALAFLVPVAVLLSGSVATADGWGLGRFTEFFADSLYREVVWRTIRLGALVTLTCAALGYVAALAIVQAGPTWKGRFVGLIVLPLMISPVARTYAWIVILGRTGMANQLITGLGLSAEPLRLLFTETAVFIGLVQLFLPLMVLSLVSALENLPADVVPAARVLGAGWMPVFFRVILPLTREGLVTGGTLVFTGAITAYITPAVLGGSKVLMLETLLYQRVSVSNDFVSASVIAVILIAMGVAAHTLLKRAAKARAR